MTIIPDLETAIVLTIPFLVTYVALHFILFKPLYGYLKDRDRAVVTAREEARELSTRIEDRTTALEEKLDGAREEVAALRAAARSQARDRLSRRKCFSEKTITPRDGARRAERTEVTSSRSSSLSGTLHAWTTGRIGLWVSLCR